MNTCIIQTDIVWADPQANLKALGKASETWPEADLYVLPEMFSTGFVTHPEGMAEEEGGCASLGWMREFAARKHCAVAGSIALHTEDGRYANRLYFITPYREWHYDKHHLFTYGGEHEHFSAGERQVIAEWCGVRFRLCICYDLRFPAWCRNTASGRYDCLLCVASWPSKRAEAWKVLLRSRAIENQSYVIGVNRVGTDPGCIYSGDSGIIGPNGEETAACTAFVTDVAVAEIDTGALQSLREEFPSLRDADSFVLA